MKGKDILLGLGVIGTVLYLASRMSKSTSQEAASIVPGADFSVPGITKTFPDTNIPDLTYPSNIFPSAAYPALAFPFRPDVLNLNLDAVEGVDTTKDKIADTGGGVNIVEAITQAIKNVMPTTGAAPSGAAPSGVAPSGVAPSGAAPSGVASILDAIAGVKETIAKRIPDLNLDLVDFDFGDTGGGKGNLSLWQQATQGFTRSIENIIPNPIRELILNPVPAWYSEEYLAIRKKSDEQFARAGLTEVNTYAELQKLITANPEVKAEVDAIPQLGDPGYLKWALGRK